MNAIDRHKTYVEAKARGYLGQLDANSENFSRNAIGFEHFMAVIRDVWEEVHTAALSSQTGMEVETRLLEITRNRHSRY